MFHFTCVHTMLQGSIQLSGGGILEASGASILIGSGFTASGSVGGAMGVSGLSAVSCDVADVAPPDAMMQMSNCSNLLVGSTATQELVKDATAELATKTQPTATRPSLQPQQKCKPLNQRKNSVIMFSN